MHTIAVPTIHCDKMAVTNMSFRQRTVSELFVKENSAADIYGRLSQMYGDASMGARSVRRWVQQFKGPMTLKIFWLFIY